MAFATASRIALVVGTLITVINQGSVVQSGDAGGAIWLRVVANYAVPYAVSSLGYLVPFRQR